MKKVLVHWITDANEMDIEGYTVLDEEEWDEYKKAIENLEKSFSVYAGSNEEIDYDNGKCLLAELDITFLTDLEFKVLEKLNLLQVGFDEWIQAVEVEDDEDYDEEEDDEYYDEEEEDEE